MKKRGFEPLFPILNKFLRVGKAYIFLQPAFRLSNEARILLQK
jgi:hypothetical protein